MRIIRSQFCALSSQPIFLTWLRNTHPLPYNDLRKHLEKGIGCSANANKMTELLMGIVSSPIHRIDLIRFLRRNFPSVIDDTPVDDDLGSPVFKGYVHGANTIPRRMVFKRNILRDMDITFDNVISQFQNTYKEIKSIVVGDKLFIEYVPNDYANKSRDEYNWHIEAYSRSISENLT